MIYSKWEILRQPFESLKIRVGSEKLGMIGETQPFLFKALKQLHFRTGKMT